MYVSTTACATDGLQFGGDVGLGVVGTVGAVYAGAGSVEECELSREEGAEGWQADTYYADVDLDYGPEA